MRAHRLAPSQRAWIASADTFFIASGYQGEGESATYGMDASHRGGEPGFVEVVSETCIQFPDYAGNNHFNTIGNLILDARAGFLFVDFVTGSLLQLTGQATVDWDSDAVAAIPGARRLVTFNIRAILLFVRGSGKRRWLIWGLAISFSMWQCAGHGNAFGTGWRH